MPYTIAPVNPADIPFLTAIQWAALSTNPLIQVLYPRGATPALKAFTIASYERAITFPSARLIKATDDATGELVGFAKWIIYHPGHEEENPNGRESGQESRRRSGWVRDKYMMPPMPPDCHGTLLERWGNIINRTRKRITGPRGHACRIGTPLLDIVHVLPSRQRDGVGASLIDWGLEMADTEGLQCYVEASPVAYSLCRRIGFRHVADMRVELGNYKEGYRDYRNIVMIRPPFGGREREGPYELDDNHYLLEEAERSYPAEAQMLTLRSSSSLRAVLLRGATNSIISSSQKSTTYEAP
ncbi:MAG: hypothetical protein Q9163_002442 [Psora crenata]